MNELKKNLINELNNQYEICDELLEMVKHLALIAYPNFSTALICLIEEDLRSGYEWNGCLQSIESHIESIQSREEIAQ